MEEQLKSIDKDIRMSEDMCLKNKCDGKGVGSDYALLAIAKMMRIVVQMAIAEERL